MEKRYFTIPSFVEAVLAKTKADPRYKTAVQKCKLYYELIPYGLNHLQLRQRSFDVVSHVTYGGSEGIYGDILMDDVWHKSLEPTQLCIFSFKTLKTDKEAYLAMEAVANLFCYHAMEVRRKNMDRFD